MSVYRKPGTPYLHYDFQIKGHRFHGSTGKTNRRDAEQVEKDERSNACLTLAALAKNAISTAIIDVSARYWQEVGQHHKGAATTFRDLNRLVDYFGPNKRLEEILDDDVSRLIAWRRGHSRKDHRKNPPKNATALPLISPATVNRSTTEVLKKLFTRAKMAWGVKFDHEPDWKKHWLEEPEERVRELLGNEGERLDEAARDDYRPILAFADASGLRLNECLLKWNEVNWDARLITKIGKGGKKITVPITSVVREILWPLVGQNSTFVFTYVAARTCKKQDRVKGHRYPVTYNGLKTEWKRSRLRAGVIDFRFHDKRHDFATKLLRDTGNLKLVQKALNHRKLETTLKYAHVLQDEVSAAAERVQKSRRKSRSNIRKIS